MTVEAYAKVNLTLEVLGIRPDGYHALRSVVVPVSLSDTIEIVPRTDGFASDTGYPDDLILKAARVLDRAAPAAVSRGAFFRVTKRIPAGGGLGGGSADAAAALIALNGLWACGFSRAELATLGAEVGSDVPTLVLAHPSGEGTDRGGRAVRMEGRGERVSYLSEEAAPERTVDLVLANPGVHASTPEVFRACPSRAEASSAVLATMASALRTGDPARIGAALVNDMEAAAVSLYPPIRQALDALREAGVSHPLMSGSGATVFGIVPSRAEADALAEKVRAKGFSAWTAVAWIG